MPFFVAVGVIFTLALLGILGYFKLTKAGRVANAEDTLDEAHLGNKLMDYQEETNKVLGELSARKDELIK